MDSCSAAISYYSVLQTRNYLLNLFFESIYPSTQAVLLESEDDLSGQQIECPADPDLPE